VFNFLLEATLVGTLLIVLGLIIRRFLRGKLGSRAIYAAWLLVALRLLVPIALPNPAMNELRPTLSTDQGARPIADQIRVRFQDSMSDLSWQLQQNTPPEDRGAYSLSGFFLDVAAYTTYGWTGKWVLLGYLGVAGLVLGYMVAQNVYFCRRLRKNRIGPLPQEDQDRYLSLCQQFKVKPIPVYLVDPLPGPCLVGVFRPFIALPLDTPPDRLPHALMHELCHRKAHDGIWGLVRNACCIVHWFNPAVWYAAQQARIDCELACDDRVAATLGTEDKVAYANTLVQDAAQKNAPRLTVVATGMTMKGRHMKKRITAILQSRQVKRWSLIVFGLLALIALLLAFATAERYAPGYDMELAKSIYLWQLDDPFSPDLPEMEPLAAREISTKEDAANFASLFLSSPYIALYFPIDGVYVAQTGDQWTVAMPTVDEGVELRFTKDGHVSFFATWNNPWEVEVNQPGRIRDSARKAVDAYVRAFARDCLQGFEIETVVIAEDLCNLEGRYFNCQVLNTNGDSNASVLVQVAPMMCVKQVVIGDGMSAGIDMAGDTGIIDASNKVFLSPEAQALQNYIDMLEQAKGSVRNWTLEEKAEWDRLSDEVQLSENADYIPNARYSLPTPDVLQEAEALIIAKDAIQSTYALETETVDSFSSSSYYTVFASADLNWFGTANPIWTIEFYWDDDPLNYYYVYIDAITQTVVNMLAPGEGNG
ncbi:MAG: M56 family metallopeptidase, partial [Clostridia bacterium]|nr:M56 family metallopeptidase [Clostridia bacterium]